MSGKSIGFIGGGRITRVFLGGWAKAGKVPSTVVVSDIDAGVLASLKQSYGAIEIAANDNARAAAQNVVFVALHPPVIPDALAKVKSSLTAGAIVVSLAPKWTIAKLAGMLDGFDRLARIIPNAPRSSGPASIPSRFPARCRRVERDVVRGLLHPLGKCCETAEEKLEAYAR